MRIEQIFSWISFLMYSEMQFFNNFSIVLIRSLARNFSILKTGIFTKSCRKLIPSNKNETKVIPHLFQVRFSIDTIKWGDRHQLTVPLVARHTVISWEPNILIHIMSLVAKSVKRVASGNVPSAHTVRSLAVFNSCNALLEMIHA